MNIFYLDKNQTECAKAHYDAHVVKMILESAQLLSTAHHIVGEGGPYKKTHDNHPSAVWVRSSIKHYMWLYILMEELGKEYTHRFGKIHKTILDHSESLAIFPRDIKAGEWQEPPLAMPEHCRLDNAVEAYRNYYLTEKINLMRYTNRDAPWWLQKKIATIPSI